MCSSKGPYAVEFTVLLRLAPSEVRAVPLFLCDDCLFPLCLKFSAWQALLRPEFVQSVCPLSPGASSLR